MHATCVQPLRRVATKATTTTTKMVDPLETGSTTGMRLTMTTTALRTTTLTAAAAFKEEDLHVRSFFGMDRLRKPPCRGGVAEVAVGAGGSALRLAAS
jgi:hypothetical protein